MKSKTKKTNKKPVSLKMVHSSVHNEPVWNVRVSRFNPLMDFTPRTHEYTLSPKEGESILDLLTRIKHTQDGSLTFRGSCGYGGCGTCGVRVNGKPVLGCVTQAHEHMDENNAIRLDPLEAESTLKDLVIDEKPFFDEFLRVKPWLVPRAHEEKRHHKMGIQDVEKLGNAQQCIMCGLCNANAKAEKTGELGPAAFVKGYRYTTDARDGDVKRISSLATELPVHYSLEKANLCPRDIAPGDKIRFIRESAEKLAPKNKEEKQERFLK